VSGPPRDALRPAQIQWPVCLQGCGAFKLPAPPSDGHNSRLVRRGTPTQLFCGTQTRKIFRGDPDASQAQQADAATSRTRHWEAKRGTIGSDSSCGESQHKIAGLQRHGTLQTASPAAPLDHPGRASGHAAVPGQISPLLSVLAAYWTVVSARSWPASLEWPGLASGSSTPWLPRIADGTERMTRAGDIPSVPRRKSEKAHIPRLLVMRRRPLRGLRNVSDILRSRISQRWRIPCSARSLARLAERIFCTPGSPCAPAGPSARFCLSVLPPHQLSPLRTGEPEMMAQLY
jgi:hypothetical protein